MKTFVNLAVLAILSTLFTFATTLEKVSFYKAFRSEDQTEVEKHIAMLHQEHDSVKKNAYLGALKMKMANFKSIPKKKLQTFKEGHKLFESALNSEPKNIEYRFIRFAIQENCPKVLKYNTNISEDKALIIENYRSLDTHLKKFILDYAGKSTLLNKNELQ